MGKKVGLELLRAIYYFAGGYLSADIKLIIVDSEIQRTIILVDSEPVKGMLSGRIERISENPNKLCPALMKLNEHFAGISGRYLKIGRYGSRGKDYFIGSGASAIHRA